LAFESGFTIAAAAGVTLKLGGSMAPQFPANPGASFEIGAPGETGVVVWSANSTDTNVENMALDIRGGTLKAGAGPGLSHLLDDLAGVKLDAGATLDIAGIDATIGTVLSGGGALTNSGKLASVTVSNAMMLSGLVSGALSLDVEGLTTLADDDTYSGGTAISGYLTLGQSGSKGSVLGSIVDDGVLIIDHANTFTLANPISGAGFLRQIGAGETIIDGANSFSGGTSVYAGTLAVGNSGALGSGALDLNGGELLGTQPRPSPTSSRSKTPSRSRPPMARR
jgi:autotransporter-associated beta strand protein